MITNSITNKFNSWWVWVKMWQHWFIEWCNNKTIPPALESIIQSHYSIVKPTVVHSDVNIIKMDSNTQKYASATISRTPKIPIVLRLLTKSLRTKLIISIQYCWRHWNCLKQCLRFLCLRNVSRGSSEKAIQPVILWKYDLLHLFFSKVFQHSKNSFFTEHLLVATIFRFL